MVARTFPTTLFSPRVGAEKSAATPGFDNPARDQGYLGVKDQTPGLAYPVDILRVKTPDVLRNGTVRGGICGTKIHMQRTSGMYKNIQQRSGSNNMSSQPLALADGGGKKKERSCGPNPRLNFLSSRGRRTKSKQYSV